MQRIHPAAHPVVIPGFVLLHLYRFGELLAREPFRHSRFYRRDELGMHLRVFEDVFAFGDVAVPADVGVDVEFRRLAVIGGFERLRRELAELARILRMREAAR